MDKSSRATSRSRVCRWAPCTDAGLADTEAFYCGVADRCRLGGSDAIGSRSAVAEAVVRLAQSLALDTVAEGVETVEQADELTVLGYRTGQGYLFARPMLAGDVTVLLTTGVPSGHRARG